MVDLQGRCQGKDPQGEGATAGIRESGREVQAGLDVHEEDGDEEEEDEEGDDEPEGEEGSIVDEDPLSEEEGKPKKQDKGKGRHKKSLAQNFFQEPNSDEDDPHLGVTSCPPPTWCYGPRKSMW